MSIRQQEVAAEKGDVQQNEAVRLKVANLAVNLGRAGPAVVRDISFSVRAGEVLGLVGESGSGKTTVALALSAYTRRGLSITSGEVFLDGVDLLRLRPAKLREKRGAAIAYVPQDPSSALNPALRISTQLRETLTVHKHVSDTPDARVHDVLEEVRLEPIEVLRRYPHQLSGGQQQRVALAMAFACRPSLIVLDEPTTGLDVSTQRHVLETVRKLCSSYDVAAVYVSHDLAVVSELVSQVAVMYAGGIVEIGPARNVLDNPAHPYTRGLIQALPSLDRSESVAGIPGQAPRPGSHPAGCAFEPRCRYAMALCREESPPPVSRGGVVVRCHRAAEIASEASHRTEPGRRTLSRPISEASGVLSVRRLSAWYGSSPVLLDVSFDVEPESCLAIVGESGSGKTTLARCVVGMHENWDGTITYAGQQLGRGARHRPRSTLKQIQYIFQNPYASLNPRNTVGQILTQPLDHFFRLSVREKYERVARMLEEVSLDEAFFRRFPDELSGGERQRVAVARALIVEPDLLICDEVTSALDVSVQALIVELLRTLQREHRLAMVFITHNVALVQSVAQTAIVLNAGRIVEAGSAQDVLEHPSDPYTISLMNDIPTLASSAATASTRTSSAAIHDRSARA